MPTLVVRDVPEDLYHTLKRTAAANGRSMNRQALVILREGLGAAESQPRPTFEETMAWLAQDVWVLPELDARTGDEILGYGDDGLPG